MSTRRRLGKRDRAVKGELLPQAYRCKYCNREFAKGTPKSVLDDHVNRHTPTAST